MVGVGLLSRIIGVDKTEIEEIRRELSDMKVKLAKIEAVVPQLAAATKDLRERQKLLEKSLSDKADRWAVEALDRELSLLENHVKVLSEVVSSEIERKRAVMEVSRGENPEEVLIELLRRGVDTPTELSKAFPYGNKTLYELLDRLIAKKKVRKLKRGRRVHYVLTEE